MRTPQERVGHERVTWCMTYPGYAREEMGCDGSSDKPHDHYDFVQDADGNPLYRLDPVGTTYLTPDGWTIRLRGYDDDPFIEPPISDHIRPQYDAWTPGGGATSLSDYQVLGDLWDGVNLRPGVIRIVPVVPEGGRPAPGSLYLRPNGEAWRLRGFVPDWTASMEGGKFLPIKPDWSVALPSGAQTNGGDTLPDDAWLVWAP